MRQEFFIATGARNDPDALAEKFFGEVEGFGLDVLWKAEGDGTGVGGRGEDAHGFGQGSEELLGALDAVPVAGDGLEAIVDGNILSGCGFQLLENWSDVAASEDIAGKQQYGNTIDGCGGGAGEHVGCAGADGSGAGECAETETGFGEGGGGVDHGLFVAAEVVAKAGILFEGLAYAGDVAMAEDAEAAFDEAMLVGVTAGKLGLKEGEDGLGDGEASGHGEILLVRGARDRG